MLTDEQLKKFQSIWMDRFGKELSRDQALEYGLKLIRLFQVVIKESSSDYPKGSLEKSEIKLT